jgi:hypothetical protein
VCPEDLNSCYFLYTSTSSYSATDTKCTALGGTPVQWNTAYEQRTIESYFKVGALVLRAAAGTAAIHGRSCDALDAH